MDGVDTTVRAIQISSAQGDVSIEGFVDFANVTDKITDFTGRRSGRNKIIQGSVQATSVANGSGQAVTFNWKEPLTNLQIQYSISSVSSPAKGITCLLSSTTATSATLLVYNDSGVSQAVINVEVSVSGD